MAEFVYGLCALTSLACAILLLRGYWRGHHRLLLRVQCRRGARAKNCECAQSVPEIHVHPRFFEELPRRQQSQ